MELEMRSVELGDMKSVIVDEMSILWSAIRSSAQHNETLSLKTDISLCADLRPLYTVSQKNKLKNKLK